jgi:hypothetical protein
VIDNETIKKSILTDIPILITRVTALEKKQEKFEKVQEKIVRIEGNLKTVSEDLGSVIKKVDFFVVQMNKSFIRFIYWLVGTVLLSLVIGFIPMFTHQYNSYKSLLSEINCVEKSLIEEINGIEKQVLIYKLSADTTRKK